jgi:hypothetical protein
MTSYTTTKTLTALLLAALALGACKDSAQDQAQAAGQEANAETGEQTADAAGDEPELPKADFWKPVAPLLASNYGGGCTSGLEMKPVPDTITIAADGKLSVGDYSTSLLKSELKLTRSVDTKAAPGNTLIAGDDDVMLSMMSRAGGQGDHAMLKYGEKVLTCDKAKNVLPLAGKTLYSLYASMLDSSARKIRCIKVGTMAFTDVDYRFEKGVAKVQDEIYDLAKMNLESVNIGKEQDTLAYHASDSDQRSLLIMLDRSGKLMHVTAMGKAGEAVYACDELNHG